MYAGIDEFSGEPGLPEIRCVFKRLYSDFIVVEIPADGQVLSSTSIKVGPSVDEPIREGADAGVEVPERFLDSDMEKLKNVVNGELEQCVIDLKGWSKQERKCLYEYIRFEFGNTNIQTGCTDGELTIKRITDKQNQALKRMHWPENRGDFLHFTMVKQNIDSQSAIHLIAKKARIKPSTLAISGTKDRRATTVQRVSAFRVLRQRMEAATLCLRGIWLRDFCYATEPLKLGDACGNRFSVVLRDLNSSYDAAQLSQRIDQWQRVGFLNYFGAQRFGTCGVDTAKIGRLMLSEDWEEATQELLKPRAEANESLNECLKRYALRDANAASEALKLLEQSRASASATVERALLAAFVKNGTGAHKAAILALRRDMRYIHAYQSLVFNKIVSRRRAKFGLVTLKGDLNSEGNLLAEKDGIESVCLPLPSLADTKFPKNEVGNWYEEIASEDGIQSEQFDKLEKQFGLGSVYRPFLVHPANVSWDLLTYTRDNEPIQHCEFLPKDISREEEEVQSELPAKKALQISFDLPTGSYATVALRELLRTELDKETQKALEEQIKKESKIVN